MDKITALYVRVSTDEQSREGYSIETQVEKLTAYAKFQGWQNVEIFADEGESAKDMNRPAMKRLLKLIQQERAISVVTMAVDRLSRNLLDMLQFIELCEKHGTAYVCTALNFDTSTPIGRMVLQILAAFAEFERAMIATRVKSTMQEIATKQKRYLAVPPFGYQFDEHRNLVPIPEEVTWLIKAADMFIMGHGYRAVSKYLNDAGVVTRKGAPWASATVRQMLTNELYIGKLVWNRRYYDKEGKQHWRDPAEWIVHEDAHPPILSMEQWNAVQERITRRMPHGGQKQAKHRLSGLMVCACCGAKMVSRNYGSQGPHRDRKIFVCQDYQKRASCRFNYIFVDEAEAQLYVGLEQIAEGNFSIPIENFTQAYEARATEWVRREAVIDQKFQRQIQAYENGLISDRDLKIARDRIEKERELLEEEKKRANRPMESKIESLIKRQAKQLLWLWNNGELPIIQDSLRILFDSFVVLDGKITESRFAESIFLEG